MKLQQLPKKEQYQVSDQIRDYYEWSRPIIPAIDSREFFRFVSTQNQLCTPILDLGSKKVKFSVLNHNTAGYSHTDNLIFTPAWYYKKDFLMDFISDDDPYDIESISIALSNGSIVHESLHSVLTDCGFDFIVGETRRAFRSKFSEEAMKKFDGGMNTVTDLCQILEDLFIEADRSAYVSSLRLNTAMSFLNMKNSIMFNSEEFLFSCKKLMEKPSPSSFIKMIAFFKNKKLHTQLKDVLRSFKFCNPLVAHLQQFIAYSSAIEYAQAAKKSRTADRFSHYATIIFDVFNCLEEFRKLQLERIEKAKADEGGEEEEIEEDGESEEEQAFGEGIEEFLKMLASFIIAAESVYEGSEKIEGNEALELMAKAMSGEIESLEKLMAMMEERSEQKLGENVFGRFKKVTVFDILEAEKLSKVPRERIVKSAVNYSFLSQIRQMRNVNHTLGPARKSGSKINNLMLNRIVTDEKIFSNREQKVASKGVPEVVILIDWSGSIGKPFGLEIISEAKAIFLALRSLNMAVSVYAHTGALDNEGYYKSWPGCFHICSSKMHETNLDVESRFEALSTVKQSHNYDGLIIQHLVEKAYTSAACSKLLISLSDGSPSGDGYDGYEAESHTMKVISDARKHGVSVVSFSIKSEVLAKNNKIYGTEFNMNATGSVKASFEKLFKQMQKKGTI